jgi:hypothetical protein
VLALLNRLFGRRRVDGSEGTLVEVAKPRQRVHQLVALVNLIQRDGDREQELETLHAVANERDLVLNRKHQRQYIIRTSLSR